MPEYHALVILQNLAQIIIHLFINPKKRGLGLRAKPLLYVAPLRGLISQRVERAVGGTGGSH
jgi:hypothetical protein